LELQAVTSLIRGLLRNHWIIQMWTDGVIYKTKNDNGKIIFTLQKQEAKKTTGTSDIIKEGTHFESV
jgi:hypothetical protein